MKGNTPNNYLKSVTGITFGLMGLTIIAGGALTTSLASADDVVDEVSITVPTSCTMSGSGMSSHTAEIANGIYQANIGTTTINALCNDNNGFSIYAAGYTGEEIGGTNSNKLVGTSASSNATIDTGTATSAGNPDVSNWAMKLATDSQATYPITILSDSSEQSFASYHAVPNEYTKVATRLTGTDTGTGAVGSTLTTTYAAYISKTQPADTYSGKVKYTLVHPNTEPAPTPPSPVTPPTSCTTPVPNLTYMQDLNSSNKATVLSNMTEDQQYYLADKRDDKTYCVAKLKDGNIWMTQNLDHDIVTDGTVTYNNTTTDLGWNGTSYSTASWSPVASTHASNNTEWGEYDEDTNPDGGNYTHAESYDPGNLYWNGYTYNDTIDDETECTSAGGTWDDSSCDLGDYTTSTGNSHYHLGNYYNWTAAIAMNDSSSYTTEYQDVNQSICPANWTLPKSGNNTSNGSFQYLVNQYGWNDSDYEITNPNIWNTPIKTFLAGYWYGSLNYVGDYGDFWSSVVDADGNAYDLYAYGNGYVYPSNNDDRDDGNSVRCLAR